jgi:hypothetical protein
MACDVGPCVNPLQNKEIQHVNIVFEQPNMKGNHA